jgi:hypothetical protein
MKIMPAFPFEPLGILHNFHANISGRPNLGSIWLSVRLVLKKHVVWFSSVRQIPVRSTPSQHGITFQDSCQDLVNRAPESPLSSSSSSSSPSSSSSASSSPPPAPSASSSTSSSLNPYLCERFVPLYPRIEIPESLGTFQGEIYLEPHSFGYRTRAILRTNRHTNRCTICC